MSKTNYKQQNKNKHFNDMQVQLVIAYYKRNLDVMLERELGIKTSWWQKFLLNLVQVGIKQ